MTKQKAIEVLKQVHIVAHHDNDGIEGEDMCGDIDRAAKELDEALDIVMPLLEKTINKQKIELKKKSDARKLLIEDFERNSFDELYSNNEYFLMNTKISWIVTCLYDDEQISKKTALSLINEVLEGKI